jgi:undecaprenyl-diphosphatase
MHRIAGIELSVLLALLLVAGGMYGFVALADEVSYGQTRSFDEWSLRCLRRADDPAALVGPAWATDAIRGVTSLGGVAVLVGLNLAVAATFIAKRKYRTLAFVLASVLGGLILSMMLKAWFERPRPQIVPHLCSVTDSSFPSGHSMMSAVVYLTLGEVLAARARRRRFKLMLLSMALLLTALVGCSRVFLGVHYPSDVLAGWTAGLVWTAICWLLGRQFRSRPVAITMVENATTSLAEPVVT